MSQRTRPSVINHRVFFRSQDGTLEDTRCLLDDEYAIYDVVLVAFLFMRLPVRLLALNRTVLHTLAAGAFLDWSILTA